MRDDKLLKRAGRGDETAFLLLYERHREAVFRFAFRLSGTADVAEDVTHECFVHLIAHAADYDPTRASLRTYLCAAARNLTVSRLRRAGTEVPVDDLAVEPAALAHDPLHVVLERELSTAVQRAVLSLSALQREAVILFEFEDLSLLEIAAVVGADVGTIKGRLHRARQRLRQALAPYFRSAIDHPRRRTTAAKPQS